MTITLESKLTEKALTWSEKAWALQVADAATYEQAAEYLRGIAALRREAEEHHRPIIDAAHKAHRAALAALQRIDAPLKEAEGALKRGLLGYEQKQERLRRAEEARLREEAERLAAEQREAELEALEAAGADAGQVAELAAAPLAVTPVYVPRTARRVQGISTRENWVAEIYDKAALVRAVAASPALLDLLQANEPALNAMARALKSTMSIPGVRAVNRPVISARRA